MQERSCVGHAQSHGHRIGCMAGYKSIVRTFIGLWKAGNTALLAERHTTRKNVLLLLYNGKRSVLIQKKTAPEGTV